VREGHLSGFPLVLKIPPFSYCSGFIFEFHKIKYSARNFEMHPQIQYVLMRKYPKMSNFLSGAKHHPFFPANLQIRKITLRSIP
jgi:hypothetical protein